MIKANNVLIAWTGSEHFHISRGQFSLTGSIAVGPLLTPDERDWTEAYEFTGGAADVERRHMEGDQLKFHLMRDWYELVYGYGLHPYVVHTAFLQIEEYQAIIKEMGMGPDEGEFGHDRSFGSGRSVQWPLPEIEVRRVGASTHVWPKRV